jgi:hypothetical protein
VLNTHILEHHFIPFFTTVITNPQKTRLYLTIVQKMCAIEAQVGLHVNSIKRIIAQAVARISFQNRFSVP